MSPGEYVVIKVSDNGIGMDQETQARIFEPFFTTKSAGRRTGIGLATVYGIVKQSGGHVWVYSEPGKGTVFRIYFPRTRAAVTQTDLRAVIDSFEGNETVLLVEDDPQVRAAATLMLSRSGYQALECQNGGEALLVCEQHEAKIDLLVADVVMPKLNGPQLVKRLLEIRPGMKALCMSGYTDDVISRHGMLESGVAFIQKPLTPKTFLTKVRHVLNS